MPAVLQTKHHEDLVAANAAVITRLRTVLNGVSEEALHRKPADGGWSMAEVLEHLIVSADSYLEPMHGIVSGASGARAPDAVWKPTFMGGMLAQSLRNPRKLPSPRGYKVGLTARPNVVAEFFKRQEEVGRRIAAAGSVDWRKTRMRSPVLPILSMNLGDALTVLVVHAERHAGQIERVKREVVG